MTTKHRSRFRAYVDLRTNQARYRLLGVWNISEGRPFRNHLWIDWHRGRQPKVGQCIEFEATMHFYRKRSGKLRFGLKDPKFVAVCGCKLCNGV